MAFYLHLIDPLAAPVPRGAPEAQQNASAHGRFVSQLLLHLDLAPDRQLRAHWARY